MMGFVLNMVLALAVYQSEPIATYWPKFQVCIALTQLGSLVTMSGHMMAGRSIVTGALTAEIMLVAWTPESSGFLQLLQPVIAFALYRIVYHTKSNDLVLGNVIFLWFVFPSLISLMSTNELIPPIDVATFGSLSLALAHRLSPADLGANWCFLGASCGMCKLVYIATDLWTGTLVTFCWYAMCYLIVDHLVPEDTRYQRSFTTWGHTGTTCQTGRIRS
jgi:hypothetical protein